jgi:hypothetical protein
MVVSLWYGRGVRSTLALAPTFTHREIHGTKMERAFGVVLAFFLVALIIYLVVHFVGWVF